MAQDRIINPFIIISGHPLYIPNMKEVSNGVGVGLLHICNHATNKISDYNMWHMWVTLMDDN